MRFVLEFIIEKNKIDLEYRKVFMHFLKGCVTKANDGKYYENYYGDTKQKNYSFSVFFDGPQFMKEEITLSSNRIKMIFSTSDELTGFIFYSSFLEKKHKKVDLANNNHMTLKSVMKIAEPTVKNNKMLIKMNSPLVIRKHNKEKNLDRYYSCASEEFCKEAKIVIGNQLIKEGFSSKYADEISITPVKCRKIVVKHYGCMIEASLGNFLVEGDSHVLTYLIQSGLGSRKSECFGMAELLTDDI